MAGKLTISRLILVIASLLGLTLPAASQDELQLVVSTSGEWGGNEMTEGLLLVQGDSTVRWSQLMNDYQTESDFPLQRAVFQEFIQQLKREIEDKQTKRDGKSDGSSIQFAFIDNKRLVWVGSLDTGDVMTHLKSSSKVKGLFMSIVQYKGAASAGRLRSYLLSALPDSERAQGFRAIQPKLQKANKQLGP